MEKINFKVLADEGKTIGDLQVCDHLHKDAPEQDVCEDCMPGNCPHCGLSMDEHDGSGFCPPGTEEFGGRR